MCIFLYHPKMELEMLFFQPPLSNVFFLNRFIASTLDEASDFGEHSVDLKNNLSLCFLRF